MCYTWNKEGIKAKLKTKTKTDDLHNLSIFPKSTYTLNTRQAKTVFLGFSHQHTTQKVQAVPGQRHPKGKGDR